MKSGVNWQTNSNGGANVAGINASDTVTKEASQPGETNSISSNTASLTPATAIKVVSSVPPATEQPAPSQPPQAASESPPPPETKSPDSIQTTQPSSTQQTAQPSTQTIKTSQAQPSETPAPTVASPAKQVSGGVLNGKALSLPKPDYPASARSAGASGVVVVEVTVDESGKVVAARALSGHPMLRAAAIAAARQARFAPTTLSGQPVKVTGIINYNFVVR